jgi:hypothetical protein
MEKNSQVAAVVGKSYDVYRLGKNAFSEPQIGRASAHRGEEVHKLKYVFESSLFRRQSLFAAGNFQPFLRAEEEAEISHRLRQKGYHLFYLPYKSIYHYSMPRNTLKETLRRTKGLLHAGIADMAAYALRKGYLFLLWDRCKMHFLFALLAVFSVSGVSFGMIFREHAWALSAAGILPTYVLFLFLKKKSINEAVAVTLDKMIVIAYMFPALFHKLKEASDYPQDVNWIRR